MARATALDGTVTGRAAWADAPEALTVGAATTPGGALVPKRRTVPAVVQPAAGAAAGGAGDVWGALRTT